MVVPLEERGTSEKSPQHIVLPKEKPLLQKKINRRGSLERKYTTS